MDTQSAIEALNAAYSKRPKCEKHLSFEQFIKLEKLRIDTVKERERKVVPKGEDTRFKPAIGDRVYVTVVIEDKRKRLSGYVQNITKTGNFKVSTGIGEFTVEPQSVCKREPKKELNPELVPERIKALSTERLLSIFKRNRNSENGVYFPGIGTIHIDVIKAELNTREHILKPGEKLMKSKNIK